MDKILLALNSHQLNTVTIDFACYLAHLTKSKLTALFLKDEGFEFSSPANLRRSYKENVGAAIIEQKDIFMEVDKGIQFFIEACERRGVKADVLIRGEVYGDTRTPAKEVIGESRFADLLILDPETSFKKNPEALPTDFVKEVTSSSECPVIIAPLVFDGVDEIIFCYDGGRSSVFAMKQFTYLFPEGVQKKIVVIEVNKLENGIEQKEKISSWLKLHYKKIDFIEMQGEPGEELFKYLLMKKNLFVVMGAYGRTNISNFFKRSSANLLMRVIDVPLFVSHH